MTDLGRVLPAKGAREAPRPSVDAPGIHGLRHRRSIRDFKKAKRGLSLVRVGQNSTHVPQYHRLFNLDAPTPNAMTRSPYSVGMDQEIATNGSASAAIAARREDHCSIEGDIRI